MACSPSHPSKLFVGRELSVPRPNTHKKCHYFKARYIPTVDAPQECISAPYLADHIQADHIQDVDKA